MGQRESSDSSVKTAKKLIRRAANWLGTAITKKQRELQKAEKGEQAKKPPTPAKPGAASAKATITVGDESASVELSSDGKAGGGDDKAKAPEKKDENSAKALVMKVIVAVAASLGVAGAVTVVGGSVLWVRFSEAGLPATQAVAAVPNSQLLVQGAQETIIFVLFALAAVVLIALSDPKGYLTWGTLLTLGLLVVGWSAYVWCGTYVEWSLKLLLTGLALLLAVGCVRVALSTEDRFWPLAASVFLAALVFASSCFYLVARQQDYVQGVAVLRSPTDKGLTGVFVAATDKTLYIGQPLPVGGADDVEPDLIQIPDSEKVTYAVGPPQGKEEAARRANAMLAQLIANRSQDPAPPKEEEKKDKGGAKEDKEAAQTDEADAAAGEGTAASGSGGSASAAAIPGDDVFDAFSGQIVVNRTVKSEGLCMMRFAERTSQDLSGRWWGRCEDAEKLSSILDAKDSYALPARFQAVYDMRVRATIPRGTKLTYLSGATAEQCEHEPPLSCGYNFPGGSVQYYVPDPSTVLPWISKAECTKARQDKDPAWEDCPARAE